ncbi:MAG: xanthine dehydrogenase family protein molybdopterin-binding subunit [Alphaproteobacteria bacterium]|nr:xanthine dehydrogenase family protein molybdopterin-binding subunit [Alphaproteobacteria bacterium]
MQEAPSPASETALALQQFAVGQPVRRKEDDHLLRGKGRYSDDIDLPDQAYACVLRSTHAHGILERIDTGAARAMPGVLGVWTGADLAPCGYGLLNCGMALKNRDGSPMLQTNRPALPTDKVRFVGDPIAFVVAESHIQARDAAEAIEVDITPLPAVTDAEEAAADGAPLLYDHIPNNTPLDYHYGDSDRVDAAFAAAAHVTRLDIVNNRVAVVAMEPRAGVAAYDAASRRYTLYAPTQGVAGGRASLARLLNVPKERLRVITGNVGGSFGMKNLGYPEYLCILHAARQLGRPVKWTDERSSAFLSDNHGRTQTIHAELALDRDGHFLAVRLSGTGNLGAYLTGFAPSPLSFNTGKNLASVYRTPLMAIDIRTVLTNTTLMGAYRGAGRPEANYFMERLIDRAAAETGIDRLELRRRNFIQPDELPFQAASGVTYDSGDFPAVFDHALALADYSGFAARKQQSASKARLRGIAVGCYLEVTAPPAPELCKIVFAADGMVRLITGTLDYGQGHASPFAQVLCDQLGVPFDNVQLVQDDSDIVTGGNGTGGSRSIIASGQAIVEASRLVIEKGRHAAAHLFEAAFADIEFAHGRFSVVGTGHGIGILELAQRLARIRQSRTAPSDLSAVIPDSLDVDHETAPVPSAFPNGCHVVEVEIDPDSGEVALARYTGVNDFGNVINPLLVEGQVLGGIAQGIGQALMEHVRYDEIGQPLTGTMMDYALPRADHMPQIRLVNHPVPARTNPLGAKGCGEAGCAGSLSAIVNAVLDALKDHGVTTIDMPLTPERVWRAQRASAPG